MITAPEALAPPPGHNLAVAFTLLPPGAGCTDRLVYTGALAPSAVIHRATVTAVTGDTGPPLDTS